MGYRLALHNHLLQTTQKTSLSSRVEAQVRMGKYTRAFRTLTARSGTAMRSMAAVVRQAARQEMRSLASET